MITFSIIVPVYNRAHCVGRAIESIMNQTYPGWSLVVVDDGSTDNSLVIIEEYANQDTRIKYVHRENGGISAARNTGIKILSTLDTIDYLLFIDSDDSLESNTLETIAQAVESYNLPDLVCFGINFGKWPWTFSSKMCERGIINREYIYDNIIPEHINLRQKTDNFLQPFVTNKCFKFSLITDNAVLFDEERRVWEDNAFVVHVLKHTNSIVLLDKPLYNYLDAGDDSSLSAAVNEHMAEVFIRSYKVYTEEFRNQFNFNNEYINRFYFLTLADLLFKMKEKYKLEQVESFIERVLRENCVMTWANGFRAQNRKEKILIKAFIDKDAIRVYNSLFAKQEPKQPTVTRLIQKSKRIIKTIIS